MQVPMDCTATITHVTEREMIVWFDVYGQKEDLSCTGRPIFDWTADTHLPFLLFSLLEKLTWYL